MKLEKNQVILILSVMIIILAIMSFLCVKREIEKQLQPPPWYQWLIPWWLWRFFPWQTGGVE